MFCAAEAGHGLALGLHPCALITLIPLWLHQTRPGVSSTSFGYRIKCLWRLWFLFLYHVLSSCSTLLFSQISVAAHTSRASVCVVPSFALVVSKAHKNSLSFISWRPNAVQAKQSRCQHLFDISMLLPSNLLPASIQIGPLGSPHFLLIKTSCAHDRHTVMVVAVGGPRPPPPFVYLYLYI